MLNVLFTCLLSKTLDMFSPLSSTVKIYIGTQVLYIAAKLCALCRIKKTLEVQMTNTRDYVCISSIFHYHTTPLTRCPRFSVNPFGNLLSPLNIENQFKSIKK